jgi:hypothetical protein
MFTFEFVGFRLFRFVDTPRAALKTDPGLGHVGSRQGTYGADA